MAKPPKRPNYSKKQQNPEGRVPRRGGFSKKKHKDSPEPARFSETREMRGNMSNNKSPGQRVEGKNNYENRQKEEAKQPRIKADLFGLHAVREAWANPKRYVHNLYLTEAAAKEFGPFMQVKAKRPTPVIVTKEELDRSFPPGTVHQGIGLSCQPLAEVSIADIIIKGIQKPKSVIVVLDQITDPHNIGAILRSACAFGADGVVMQSKHAPEMGGILAKTACGAVEHIDVAYETNLSRAIEKLQENHYMVIGMDEHAEKTFSSLPKYDRAVIVLGAEGPGMRRLVREHCDVLVKLPTHPPIASLNVSNAAAIALYALSY